MDSPTDQVIEWAQHYAEVLGGMGIPVDKIILFGSWSRGQVDDDSDVDLAVFSRAFETPAHLEVSGVLSRAAAQTHSMIEAIGFHTNRLSFPEKAPFLAHIIDSGIEVFSCTNRKGKEHG